MTRLVVGWCTMFVIGTDLFVVSPLLPAIARGLGVATTSAGLAVTAFSVSYMLSAPLLGQLADRLGRRAMMIRCLLGFALANLLTAAAPSLALLVLARLLAGIAAAGITPSLYALIGAAAPAARRATWMAVVVSGLLVSLSIGAPIGALAGAWLGWGAVFLGLAAASLGLAWINALSWRGDRGAAGTSAAAGPPLLWIGLLGRLAPTVLWSTALYGMYTYLGTGLSEAGYAVPSIARLLVGYGAGALAGTLLGGWLADRLGSRPTTGASILGLGIGLVGLALALHEATAMALALAGLSVLAQLFFPAQQAGLVRDFPACRATVLAWNNSALFLGMSCGALIGGQLMALVGFERSLAPLAAVAVAGWAVNWLVAPRDRPRPVLAQAEPVEGA
ncbi:MAG: MFS transporter [Alphaproteobacteria bacterium]|nr:MFS transporter [Alphaproteobacteria bacterium]